MASLSMKVAAIPSTTLSIAGGNEDLALEETTTSYVTPDYMKVKIMSVELFTNMNGNSTYITVWANPGCTPDHHKDKGDVNGKGFKEYYNSEGCSLSTITERIDLAQDLDKVNAALKSQSYPVPPGTYTGAVIRMCGQYDSDALKADGIVYKGSDMAKEHAAPNHSCGVSSATTSIIVDEGKTAVVNLQYDRSKLLQINRLSSVMGTIPASTYCLYDTGGLVYHCPQFAADTFKVTLGN